MQSSLSLVDGDSDDQKGIRFEFDANVPCLVTVHYLATEILDDNNATKR